MYASPTKTCQYSNIPNTKEFKVNKCINSFINKQDFWVSAIDTELSNTTRQSFISEEWNISNLHQMDLKLLSSSNQSINIFRGDITINYWFAVTFMIFFLNFVLLWCHCFSHSSSTFVFHKQNIARGKTDPGHWLRILIYLYSFFMFRCRVRVSFGFKFIQCLVVVQLGREQRWQSYHDKVQWCFRKTETFSFIWSRFV